MLFCIPRVPGVPTKLNSSEKTGLQAKIFIKRIEILQIIFDILFGPV